MTISVLAVSDIHNYPLPEVVGSQEADVLCIVGDLTFRGEPRELFDFEKSLIAVRSQFGSIIWIAGNHDLGLEDYRHKGYEIASRTNTTYLLDEGVTYKGVRFWGSPFSSEFGSWAFQTPRPTKKWAVLPQADVYMFHGPAHKFNDKLVSGEHVGDWDLADRLLKMSPKPKFVLSGHIHVRGGDTMERNGIKFIGCSVVNEAYKLKNSGVFFTL